DANLEIYGENVDDSANFSDTADVLDRARTTASVAWVADGVGSGYQDAPDVKTVVQEIVNRAGFAGPITLLLVGNADVDKTLQILAYELSGLDSSASLTVNYTEAASGTTRIPAIPGIPTIPSIGGAE